MDKHILLPKLNNPRLKKVGWQQNISRKKLTITNDKLKKVSVRLNCSLQRESEIQNYLSWQKSLAYKRSLVEHKGLQVCLKRKREQSHPPPTFQNGVYNGLKIESMKSEVKNVIWEQHPRTRRLRAVENVKKLWKLNGNLVDYNKSLQSLEAIIKRQKEGFPSLFMNEPSISMSPEKTKHVLVLPPIVATKSIVM